MPNKKRLLFVFDHLEAGGATSAIKNVTRALHKDCIVDVLTGVTDEPGSNRLEQDVRKYSHHFYSFNIALGASEFFLMWKIIIHIFRLLFSQVKLKEYDAICLNLTTSSIPFFLLKPFHKKTCIYFFHGFMVDERASQYPPERVKYWPLLSRIKYRLLNAFVTFAQHKELSQSEEVICFSEYSQRILREGGIHRQTTLLRPPVYFSSTKLEMTRRDFGFRDDATIILITSRIEPRKGIHLAMEAAKKILDAHPNVFFYSVGAAYNVDYFNPLFLAMRDNALTGKFTFLGPVSHEKIAQLLQLADLTLIPSVDYETLGFATLESLLFCKPVIGFDSGATPEILGPIDTRLIATETSAHSLSKRIEWFLSLSSKEKKKLGEKGKAFVEQQFDDKCFAQEFIALI